MIVKAIEVDGRELKLIQDLPDKEIFRIEDNKDDSLNNVYILFTENGMNLYDKKVEEVVNGTQVQANVSSQ